MISNKGNMTWTGSFIQDLHLPLISSLPLEFEACAPRSPRAERHWERLAVVTFRSSFSFVMTRCKFPINGMASLYQGIEYFDTLTLFIYLAIVWDLIEHICQVLWAFSRGFHVACPHAFNEFSGLIKWCLYVPIGRYWMTELESCFVNLNLSSSTLTLPITHSTRSNEILCKSSVTNIK